MAGLAVLLSTPIAALVAGVAFWRSRRDVTTVLSIFAILLFLIPARFVFPGAGGVGTPANALGILVLMWWVCGLVVPSVGLRPSFVPVHVGLFLYGAWTLVSYAMAFRRPLTPLEVSGADRGLIGLAAVIGVAVLAADGIQSRERLVVMLERMVMLVTVVALIGMIQFLFSYDVASLIRPPGLVQNTAIYAVKERSLFARPYSTTLHPIEFSVVLAATAPIALTMALQRHSSSWSMVRRWGSALVIVAATLMGVSRSGLLGLAVGVGVLALGWSWRRRLNVAVAALVFLGGMRLAVPGLLGTLKNLIINANDDPSIQGRLRDMAAVARMLSESPVVGRGVGTFNSVEYFVLDNEYYRTSLESGVVGVFVLVLLFALAIVCARRARRAGTEEDRQLGTAVAAAVSVLAVCCATFDGLAYPMFTGLLFLLVGISGACWRLLSSDTGARPHAPKAGDREKVRDGHVPHHAPPV
jgi:polysaccharide biosynthesis protein PslJ